MCACYKSVGKEKKQRKRPQSFSPVLRRVACTKLGGWVGHGATAFLVHADHLSLLPSLRHPTLPLDAPNAPIAHRSADRPGAGTARGGGSAGTAGFTHTHVWPPVCPWNLWARMLSNLWGTHQHQHITDAIAIDVSREHPHLPAAKSTASVGRASSSVKR